VKSVLKKIKKPFYNLALETQEDFIVSHIIGFESAIAGNPPDEETASLIALTLHKKGNEGLAAAAFEYLERCIEAFPQRPSDATNQVRLCILSASYFLVADQIGRDAIIAQDEALKYIRYALDNDFWDQPLLLCVTCLLSDQWVFGQHAEEVVKTKVDEWITTQNHRAVVQAAVALRGQLTPKHEIAFQDAYESLDSVEDLSWYLIALKKTDDEVVELQRKVAQSILDHLQSDSFIQAVLRSGSLAYLLSHPQLVSVWQDSGLMAELCQQTIIRDARVEDDKLICELREEGWEFGSLPLVPFEVTFAAYALVYAGFDAIAGVRLNVAPTLANAIRQASELKDGYILISPVKRHFHNFFVTLSLVFIAVGVNQVRVSIDAKVPIVELLIRIAEVLFLIAPIGAIMGWILRGDALAGLWDFIREQTGQK
jgi:hypothetical protein